MSTLYRIARCDDTKTIPNRIGLLFTNKNGDFGAIFVTEREFLHFPFSAITACHMRSHELILNVFVRPGKVPALVTLTKTDNYCQQISSLSVVSSSSLVYTGTIGGKRALFTSYFKLIGAFV